MPRTKTKGNSYQGAILSKRFLNDPNIASEHLGISKYIKLGSKPTFGRHDKEHHGEFPSSKA
jgi:hypothetical protein